MLAIKELKATPELILVPQEHQQLMKSSPEKNQDHVSDVVDQIFRIGGQRAKVTPQQQFQEVQEN